MTGILKGTPRPVLANAVKQSSGDPAGKRGDPAGKRGDLAGKFGDPAGKFGRLAGKRGRPADDLIIRE
ncbi:MAG: hypothetical protein LBT76_07725 [Tannerella sp.]|nr:hypothetical protein [Tannerella sp.]